MNERLSACITVFVCNLEPIVGSVVGILGCKYGDRMDMLHITWRMLQCSACSGSWTIYLMQSLLSSLAMRFSDTAFFLEIDMGIVVGLGWSDSQSERCTETCSTAGDAAVLQVGNIQTAGTFKPSQSSSSSIANLYFKLRKKCRDCRETAAVTADTAAGSVNHLRVAEDLIRLLLVTLLFIACPRLMSLLISLSTPNTFLCPCRDLRSRESGPGVNARRAWPGGH